MSVAWWIFILFSEGELQVARASIGFIFLPGNDLCATKLGIFRLIELINQVNDGAWWFVLI
jgi:hypothetical protein